MTPNATIDPGCPSSAARRNRSNASFGDAVTPTILRTLVSKHVSLGLQQEISCAGSNNVTQLYTHVQNVT